MNSRFLFKVRTSPVQKFEKNKNARSKMRNNRTNAIPFLKCGLLVSIIKSNGYTAPLLNTEVIGPRLTWMRDYLGSPRTGAGALG